MTVMPYGNQPGTKSQQVEQMFNTIATDYDRLNHALALGIDRRWRRTAIRSLLPYRPGQILDVATGTGDFALLNYRLLRPGQITGIDLSEGMMEVARAKVEKAGLADRIRLRREDCTHLSFADGSFDAVTVAFGVRNFEHLNRCLEEMFRVLRPGGQLVILELSVPARFPMRQLYGLYSAVVIPLLGRLLSRGGSAYTYLPQSIRAFPQGRALQTIIAKAGFGEVSFRRLTAGICTLYQATKTT
ncbi:MAG: bifunctional demethylmenaquinone methyltransferase/2-methoxy-6-polyprenyl-1,4-benzoquinol methylase UbiE [Prevotellaceae bacterium]|jgi:demethylmenaquinone methyltransferase/2-methoxy-6-polyprenyl-1,4-benzoquinol methylase|nr:bifunctional demethylmenaquinone methyltransferase/2-methoxy-6-polyprenyl-1,4-benzoquinol methylase UbiE [Prevotellaceae bacterium]